jgi:hypothetical protein
MPQSLDHWASMQISRSKSHHVILLKVPQPLTTLMTAGIRERRGWHKCESPCMSYKNAFHAPNESPMSLNLVARLIDYLNNTDLHKHTYHILD